MENTNELKLWDVVYYLEWDTIQWQSIVTKKLKMKVENSWFKRTKDLKIAENALRDQLHKQAEIYIEWQLKKFTS